jgi:hypothetical protein
MLQFLCFIDGQEEGQQGERSEVERARAGISKLKQDVLLL